jgi:hypothetical protein
MKKKINKIGAALTVLTFGLICGISGYELQSSTDSASSVLPITKGGTGNNYGNVPTADKLYEARNINEYPFDGSADINLPGIYSRIAFRSETSGDYRYLEMRPFNATSSHSGNNFTYWLQGCQSPTLCYNAIFSKKDTGGTDNIIQKTVSTNISTNDTLAFSTRNNSPYFRIKVPEGRDLIYSCNIPGCSLRYVTDASEITALSALTCYSFEVSRPTANTAL